MWTHPIPKVRPLSYGVGRLGRTSLRPTLGDLAMLTPPMDAPVVMGPLSLEEYLSWGVTDVQYELVDGWAVVNPAPGRLHQRAVTETAALLRAVCPRGHEVLVSPIDWVLWPGRPTVRQPDVVIAPVEPSPRLTVPPLLAVELLSPGSHERDLVTKRLEYAQAGLRHYWVVDPEAPAIVVFGGDDLHELARASGDHPMPVTEPVRITVVPSDLVRPPR